MNKSRKKKQKVLVIKIKILSLQCVKKGIPIQCQDTKGVSLIRAERKQRQSAKVLKKRWGNPLIEDIKP